MKAYGYLALVILAALCVAGAVCAYESIVDDNTPEIPEVENPEEVQVNDTSFDHQAYIRIT